MCAPPSLTPPLSAVRTPVRAIGESESGCKKRARGFPLWWKSTLKRFAAFPPPIKQRVPPTWDELCDEGKVHYYHEALSRLNGHCTLTIRLRYDIEDQARAQPNPADWLRRRIKLALERELGRTVEFILTPEEDAKGAFHLHGESDLMPCEFKRARARIRKECGEWPKKKRNRQVKIHPDCRPDYGWSSYICKRLFGLNAARRAGVYGAYDLGSLISVTRGIAQSYAGFWVTRLIRRRGEPAFQ